MSEFAVEGDRATPVVVDYMPASSQRYVGSPSLSIVDDGTYVASHDVFGPGSTRDRTILFTSSDNGLTWQQGTELIGQFWSSLFVQGSSLYIIGVAREFGAVVIRRSADNGRTWTIPTDEMHGAIMRGSFHTAPTPVVEHNGRIWRAMEDIGGPGGWPTHFRCFMLSAPANADLLRGDQWRQSNVLEGSSSWLNGHFHGWLEGNAVIGPQGSMLNVLRVDAKPIGNRAAIIQVSEDARALRFDPEEDFVKMPGGSVKFTLRRDPADGRYWTITDVLQDQDVAENPGVVRNTLALVSSADLKSWSVRAILWHNPDVSTHGWQYVDWQFEGDNIIAVARVSDDDLRGGAHDFHDANMLVFFRLKAFRSILAAMDKPYLLPLSAPGYHQ